VRIVVGISGASGIRLSVRLIEELNHRGVEVYAVITDGALKVAKSEGLEDIVSNIGKHSEMLFEQRDLDAPISSGSFPVDGMVVIPCSMNTLAKIAFGIADNLLLRAADVQIKMKRKLVIVPREMPLSRIHLRNLLRLSRHESIYILFPLLSYYHRPKTLEDVENFVIGRIMELLDIEHDLYRRRGADDEEYVISC
jgi:4-hydroxy-3-polyprenylbenzoate decarboxylase